MPWSETVPMEERLKFVKERMAGRATVTELCERFGISRKTGHKWISRFKEAGLAGLEEKSRAPQHHPNQTTEEVRQRLVELKREKPRWGPKKIQILLKRRYPKLMAPAVSTISDILDKEGLVRRQPNGRRRELRRCTPLVDSSSPNDSWSADHKGQFILGNGAFCYPLTITDNFSRCLLKCHALSGIDTQPAYEVFQSAFQEYGLPLSIRTDNGSPFGANRGLAISKLSLWWMRLGIRHERIQAGWPQQNGRHERMHRTLKEELQEQPLYDSDAQQRHFDRFVHEYNEERPHESLSMKTPEEIYVPSTRKMPKHLPPLMYPKSYETRRVCRNGRVSIEGVSYFVSKVLQRESVGLEEIEDGSLRVWAGYLPLGEIDLETEELHFYDEAEQLEIA